MQLKVFLLISYFIVTTGCAIKQQTFDYTNFEQSKPRSILVLPPINNSTHLKASNSVLSHTTYPLAESGYYVLPICLTSEAFKQNGISDPNEIHNIPQKKLHEIFGADAALYLNIVEYGSKYYIINSSTVIKVKASLVDLRNNKVLWHGLIHQQKNNDEFDILGGALGAAIGQVAACLSNADHRLAGNAIKILLSANTDEGILHGPYHNDHEK